MEEDKSFLGKGWGFPPTFENNGASVKMVSDSDDIQESVKILLSTELGERLMHTDFGCDLGGYLFEEIDQNLITGIRGIVTDALLYYETRIDVESVEVTEDEAVSGLLLIEIRYKVRTTNSRYNMVYPYYITEAASTDNL